MIKYLLGISLIMITTIGVVYATDGNSNCTDMKYYEKFSGITPPPEVYRPGHVAKCFTISGNVTYITYVPNSTKSLEKDQTIPVLPILHALPISGDIINEALDTGQKRDIPIKIIIDNGSNLVYGHFSLIDMPQGVQGWMSPSDSGFFSGDITKQGANATLSVFADSGAKSGNYEIPIIATQGTISDSKGNTQIDRTVIGILYLTVSGHDALWSNVDSPTDQAAQICSKAPEGGATCSGFIAYEKYPITVYSSNQIHVKLSLSDLPPRKYARFIPDEIIATPNGATSTLIVAGIVKPGVPNALYNPTVEVTATSDGLKAVNYLQIATSQNLTVMDSPSPIDLDSNFGGNGRSGFAAFGVVYDPKNYSSDPLPVKLSVLGLHDGNKIVAMPSWLSVSIPDSTFDLNPTVPYYFPVEFTSNNATLGTYSVAIGESIGSSFFTQDIRIKIYEPARFGPALSSPVESPVSGIVSQDTTSTALLAEEILIGITLGGGGIFGVFYLTRKK